MEICTIGVSLRIPVRYSEVFKHTRISKPVRVRYLEMSVKIGFTVYNNGIVFLDRYMCLVPIYTVYDNDAVV